MSANSSTKKIFDFALLGRVLQYAKPYRKTFILSILLAIALALLSPIRPYLIKFMIDEGIVHPSTHQTHWLHNIFSGSSPTAFIINVFILQIVLLLLETVFRFIFSFMAAWLGQRIVKDLRITVYKKILGLNLSQYDKTPIGTLTTRTINDIESINDIFSDGLIPIIGDILSIVLTLGFMFWIDWRLTLISLIPFPLLLIATYYFKESVKKSFTKVRNAIASLNAFVQEHITGMQVVQAFAAEEQEFAKFKTINKDHRNANIQAIFAYSVFFPVVEVVLAVSTGLLVWWVADRQIDAGLLIAFMLFLNQIFRPIRVIADKFNVIQMGMVASERVFKVLDNNNYNQIKGLHVPNKVLGSIEFDGVWFAYEAENYVLKNINFKVNPGETVAIVGHTGSGKTSIISILNKLYTIQKGAIKIDNISIDAYDIDALRSKIGIVLQDVFLFSGSIQDNVTLRNPAIPFKQVVEAATLIGVHDFIMQLPGGYQYNVMERGNTLSLGQRQLLSFIRALLYNPSILVLDEATSSIDTESEMLIQKAIDMLIAGRTSIIIAHRLSTIRKAHKIIVLDKGEIIETGTHEALMGLKGHYYKLHQLQFEENLI